MSYIETDLIFLRHCRINGPTAFYGSGTDVGCLREELANMVNISGESFQEIYVSPMKRCRETLEAAGISLGDPRVTAAPEIREISFGSIDGKAFQDFTPEEKQILEQLNRGENAAFPGGEHAGDLRKRVFVFLERILAREHELRENRRILAVTHSGVISTLLQGILECPVLNILQRASPAYGKFTGIKYFQNAEQEFSMERVFPRIMFLNSKTPGN